MKDWYAASHGELAQTTAITAAASASRPADRFAAQEVGEEPRLPRLRERQDAAFG